MIADALQRRLRYHHALLKNFDSADDYLSNVVTHATCGALDRALPNVMSATPTADTHASH